MIELSVFGLRPALPGPAERKLLGNVERGAVLYETEPYTVCENCVEDRVYGPPAAWALDGGKTVLSPVRAVEEFRWRSTPWGDMTRIVDRGAVWRAGDAGSYPALSTGVPVLDAAYHLAVDVMRRNVNEAYALPGQKGLMNAALFQGKGEGFGIWKRDAAHAALRIQNLLAPADTRRSLIYITEHGFDNGSDAAAMLPIAVWDHYLATGDKTVLFEALPGVLRCVAQADSLFDESRGLVRAEYSAAQDAFPEPENAGFCLSPQVFYAHLYLDAARICEKINEQANARGIWKARGTAMLDIIRREYWNADKACFTSGPSGSDSYQNGWWEATGAEAVLWPRFGVASGAQRDAFLRTIEANRIALSDFGFNWYPFATGKNHFWHACWPSWSLGVAVAAARAGRADLLERLIFQQVRNVLLNKTFHEVIDNDTGRAWRWPGLPWHAAAFLGFIVYGVFGLSYDETGMRFSPCVPQAFANAKLSGLAYRGAKLEVALSGAGTRHVCTIGGNAAAPTVMPDGTGACQINFTATP